MNISIEEHEYKNWPKSKTFEECWEPEVAEEMVEDSKRYKNCKSEEYIWEEEICSVD